MVKTLSFNRLILRAVLRQVSPMVIRLVSVSDQMPLHEFHDVFRTILGWNGDLGYIVRVHGQEINSFRRKMRSKALHDVPSNEELAQRANQPRNAISGDEVGILDPVCKNEGFAKGSVAGR